MQSWVELDGERPLLMGILNVTPDSFSDGGLYFSPDKAIAHAKTLEEAGVDIIDIGGESSRPFSQPVPVEEELRRVIPVIKAISAEIKIPISIDTYKAKVAREAIEAGAKIVNDISALRFDRDMARVVADYKTPVVLMHMKGTPRDMQINPHYKNVLQEVYDFLAERIDYALNQGINENQIAIDLGIGFGKRLEDNLRLIKHLSFFKTLKKPLLLGPSRKTFIGQILNIETPAQRDIGTLGVVAMATFEEVDIIRVHAAKEAKQVIKIVKSIMSSD
ncbi:MAG: dihydropteroate synthase [Candidatus Desulfofervidaceae bacterium]|nr:dihydropteroate synthase [Candidatus Desulfofervidaceae bacterium]MDL1969452.1 dihydropteroate synthase [Candidatus Desulfofervidaceae bacterium]